MEVCGVCKVEKHGLVFQTKQDQKNNTTSSADFVHTRICQYAKQKGCINTDGKINKALAYNNLGITTEQWLEKSQQITRQFEHR